MHTQSPIDIDIDIDAELSILDSIDFGIYQIEIIQSYDAQATRAMGSPAISHGEKPPVHLAHYSSTSNNTETKQRSYTVYHNGAWYGMFIAGIFLLLIAALLAGLTLAICGLDSTWLHLKSVSGSAKERYIVFLCFLKGCF